MTPLDLRIVPSIHLISVTLLRVHYSLVSSAIPCQNSEQDLLFYNANRFILPPELVDRNRCSSCRSVTLLVESHLSGAPVERLAAASEGWWGSEQLLKDDPQPHHTTHFSLFFYWGIFIHQTSVHRNPFFKASTACLFHHLLNFDGLCPGLWPEWSAKTTLCRFRRLPWSSKNWSNWKSKQKNSRHFSGKTNTQKQRNRSTDRLNRFFFSHSVRACGGKIQTL